MNNIVPFPNIVVDPYAAIPDELKQLDQWMVARTNEYDPKTSKPYKAPCDRRGIPNDHTTPANWMGFAEATTLAMRRGWSIGFCLSSGDPYTVVDLDNKPNADWDYYRELVLFFNSYTERSLSGTGLHVLIKGDMGGGKRSGGIEVYSRERFIILTGNILPAIEQQTLSTAIENRQAELDEFIANHTKPTQPQGQVPPVDVPQTRSDDEILNSICNAENGARFVDMYEHGNWHEYGYPSQSEADAAMLEMLVTHDATNEQVMRLFKKSKLYRSQGNKQDKYISRTIKFARGVKESDIPVTLAGSIENLVQKAKGSKRKAKARLYVATCPKPYPGVLAELHAYGLKGAQKAQPDLLTMGIVVAMASCVSGFYCLNFSNRLRLNLYGCGVVGTGDGKEHVQKVAEKLIREFQESHLSPQLIGKPASGEGLEDCLQPYKPFLTTIAEFSHLLEAVNQKVAASYMVNLAAMILTLFSKSSSFHQTRLKAGMPSRTIEHPMLNLLGFSTPEHLGKVLSVDNIEDGLLGRLLFAFGENDPLLNIDASLGEYPTLVKNAVTEIQNAQPKNCLAGESEAISVSIDEDARNYRQTVTDHFQNQVRESEQPFAKALFKRSYEKTLKVAGVLAVWEQPQLPQVTLTMLQWAEDFVRYSNGSLLRFAGEFMHGGQVQANAAKIQQLMERVLSGDLKMEDKPTYLAMLEQDEAVSYSWLLRMSHLEKRDFDFAVEQLVSTETVTSMFYEQLTDRRGRKINPPPRGLKFRDEGI